MERFFDIGANRGQTAARFRSMFPCYEIYAFELSESAYRKLAATAGADPKTRPFHLALGERDVPLMRLDTFCARERISRRDILKIDTQGYERKILEGAGALLAPQFIRGIFMEVLFVDLYEGQAWGGELLELLRARAYKFFGFTEIAFDHEHGWKWADAMFLPNRPAR